MKIKERSIYYTSFPIQEQSKKGSWDYRLSKIYFVGILEFSFDDIRLKQNREKDKYLSKVQLFDCEEAFEVAEFLALDKDEQFAYQQDLKARWDNKVCLDFATEKGLEQGIERGLKQGLEQGIEQGEKKIALEIAKNLLKAKMDIKFIADTTGLNLDEIEKLK